MRQALELFLPGFGGLGLHLCLDGFRLVYLGVAVLMWAVSGTFSLEYMAHYAKRRRYYVFFWATFFATAGVFLSANLYTTFLFFEIMSFTSYVWVAFDEKKESLKAAETYLAVAVVGGLALLMGMFLLYDLIGTLEFSQMGKAAKEALKSDWSAGYLSPRTQLYAAGFLMLFGFGAKAGCFPLHIWLPKAHPAAPAPASALLSGILTKAGVFGVIVASCVLFERDGLWGMVLTLLGLFTMFLGALLALFSVNLKRTLACSSISQIGFILLGIGAACVLKSIGAENGLAVRGAFLHMVNHSLFKLVLFLCAGAVFMNLHQLELNDIRGFGRKKPALAFCFLTGALGISGVPLWSGYVSKTLLHEGIVEYAKMLSEGVSLPVERYGIWKLLEIPLFWKAAEWLFLLTGAMTVAYMLKLFVAIFVEKHPDRQAEYDQMSLSYMKPQSRFALVFSSLLIVALGVFPQWTMDHLADLGQGFFMGDSLNNPVSYFSIENLTGSAISIGIGILLYGLAVRRILMKRMANGQKQYVNRWPEWLDLEMLLYRPLLQVALPGIGKAVCVFLDQYLVSTAISVCLAVSSVVCRAMDHMADGLILLASRTTHRERTEKRAGADGDRMAHIVGNMVDSITESKRKLTHKKEKQGESHSVIPGLVELEEEWKRAGKLVEESFSFGLMLFCIGLCATLLYLLAAFLRG